MEPQGEGKGHSLNNVYTVNVFCSHERTASYMQISCSRDRTASLYAEDNNFSNGFLHCNEPARCYCTYIVLTQNKGRVISYT